MEQKTQKVSGAGSLWNVNSWHWEAKDYTKEAGELLSEKIKQVVLEQDGIKVIFKNIKKVGGHAEICIRKQKQCFIYDLEAEIEWEAESDEHEAAGTMKIIDIMSDCLDIHVESVKSTEKTSISKDAERIIKKNIEKEFEVFLKDFVPNFFQKLAEANPDCLQKDAEKRQELNEKIQKAREENGEKKKQIFDEQKQKEQEMKQQFSEWNTKDKQ